MSTVPNAMRVRRALENAIVDGRYPPGSRLDPEALAQEFDCSRTPIREALQQLEASGLVRVLPKRGTYVSEWAPGELAERFEVMAEVEAYYARNSDFHHCIYRATHNAFLAQEASRLHAMLQPYRRMQLQVRNRMARSFAEHDAVVAAIRSGDAEAAAEAMRGHVVIQGDRFHDLLAAMRQDPRREPAARA